MKTEKKLTSYYSRWSLFGMVLWVWESVIVTLKADIDAPDDMQRSYRETRKATRKDIEVMKQNRILE